MAGITAHTCKYSSLELTLSLDFCDETPSISNSAPGWIYARIYPSSYLTRDSINLSHVQRHVCREQSQVLGWVTHILGHERSQGWNGNNSYGTKQQQLNVCVYFGLIQEKWYQTACQRRTAFRLCTIRIDRITIVITTHRYIKKKWTDIQSEKRVRLPLPFHPVIASV